MQLRLQDRVRAEGVLAYVATADRAVADLLARHGAVLDLVRPDLGDGVGDPAERNEQGHQRDHNRRGGKAWANPGHVWHLLGVEGLAGANGTYKPGQGR